MNRENNESAGVKVEDLKNNNIPEKTIDSIWLKTVRLVLNFITNVLLVMIVFVCLLHSCTSWSLNYYEMHILFCVLGYQFLMSQGTLVLSKYNSWSMYLKRRYRVHLNWILQMIGVAFVIVGSSLIMSVKHVNFDTAHGITGLCALITSLLGFVNGILAYNAYKLRHYISMRFIKFFHYFTGVATLLLAGVSLCLGIDKEYFRTWAGSNNSTILIVCTIIFMLLEAIDFWIAMWNKIRNL